MDPIRKIESTSHPIVKHCVRLNTEHAYREQSKTVLVEGKNLLCDLVKRHRPERLFVVEEQRHVFDDVECECIIISDQVCKKISTVQTPEGCFGEFLLPDVQWPKLSSLLVFDRIQDPGNMGTLLRTALAFGIRNVVCILPCCDIWNPKVLRAAKGAQFDMTIVSCSWEQLLQHKTDQVILVADAKGTPIQRVPKEWWLVLGNEAHGSSIPLETTKEYVSIPLIGPVESLNVAQAGAILLHELTRA